jgi:hypothetical protein
MQKTNELQVLGITRFFILLDALVWLAFAIITALGAHPALPSSEAYLWAIAGGALLTSISLAALVLLLGRAGRLVYYLTVGLLTALSILTFTDDFGVADMAVLVLHLVPLVLLIKERRWFLQN